MDKHRKPLRTNDKQIAGVDRIDAPPEDIAKVLMRHPNLKTTRKEKSNR